MAWCLFGRVGAANPLGWDRLQQKQTSQESETRLTMRCR